MSMNILFTIDTSLKYKTNSFNLHPWFYEVIFKMIYESRLYKNRVYKTKELGSVKNNLFVDEDLSEVVSRNFDRTYTELKELKLELEKIQYSYTEV